MRHFTAPVIVFCFILVGVGGFFLGRAGLSHLDKENNRLIKINQQLNRKIEAEPVVVFFLKSSSASFYLKPVLYRVRGDRDKHVLALETLLAGPPADSKLVGIFPKETKLLGLSVKNGIAYVNLNQSATQLNVGSSGEVLAVAAIVNTLTKFPDVFQVKILIEGKEVESLAGHVDLTGFLRYNDQVVDPSMFN